MTHRRKPRGDQIGRAAVLALAILLVFRVAVIEPFIVPSGSMAPTLLGHHKSLTCPRCGWHIDVTDTGPAESFADRDGLRCPHCGCSDLALDVGVTPGDQLLVNKTIFGWRSPRRWELAVFHPPFDPGRAFVKRVVGLPGESVQVKDGDVFIDQDVARKSLMEFHAVRLPVFDQGFASGSAAVPPRWESAKGPIKAGGGIDLDRVSETSYSWAVYNHDRAPGSKAAGLRDEVPYNGTSDGGFAVHDFELEGDLEVKHGCGWVALGITDGSDDLVVELPVGEPRSGAVLSGTAVTWYRGLTGFRPTSPGEADKATVYRTAPNFALKPGRTYHVALAFVDRRLTLMIDGAYPFPPLDRPPAEWRGDVARPLRMGASGVSVRLHKARLYRDIHYTPDGPHGSATPVRLGAGEYFVLGDNSPSSQDSRFWTGADGRPLPVAVESLIGKPFLVHWPSRSVHGGLDKNRVRWLR